MAAAARKREVRARITQELKRNVEILAHMRGKERGEEENESLVVREALIAHFQRPEIKAQLAEGEQLIARGELILPSDRTGKSRPAGG